MTEKASKSLFLQIKEVASITTSVITLGTLIVFGTRFVDSSKAGNATATETKKELTTFQNTMSTKLDSIQDIVAQTRSQAEKTEKKVDVISRQFNQHLSHDKSITKEELMQIMYEQNEKKNSEINNINWYDTIEPAIKIRKIPKK